MATVLAVALVALVLFLVVRQRPASSAFDPRSSSDSGARALVLLLEQQGASVQVTREPPRPGDEVRVLVLADRLDTSQRADLVEFIEAGGVAVVADPESSLHGGPGVDGGAVEVGGDDGVSFESDSVLAETNVSIGACSIEALGHLRGLYVPAGIAFPVGPDEPSCFGRRGGENGSHAFVIRRSFGDGVVIGLGDNRLLTNEYLRYADNSGLATALLVPGGRVEIVLGNEAARNVADLGSGDDTLIDLVRPSVWMAAAQAALAFVVLGAAMGSRPGRPVDERLPTPVPGSDFVRARGALLQRSRRADRSARWMRARFHRDLCDREGVPRTTGTGELAAITAARTGLDVERVRAVLAAEDDGGAISSSDDASLLALAVELERLRVAAGLRRSRDVLPPLAPTPLEPPQSTPDQSGDLPS
jgi:hypothetical protein